MLIAMNSTAHQAGYTPADIGGLVISWLRDAEQADTTPTAAIEYVLETYGFAPPMMDGTVTGDTYEYPDDPPLDALMRVRLANGLLVQFFHYGIVAFTAPAAAPVVYRLD